MKMRFTTIVAATLLFAAVCHGYKAGLKENKEPIEFDEKEFWAQHEGGATSFKERRRLARRSSSSRYSGSYRSSSSSYSSSYRPSTSYSGSYRSSSSSYYRPSTTTTTTTSYYRPSSYRGYSSYLGYSYNYYGGYYGGYYYRGGGYYIGGVYHTVPVGVTYSTFNGYDYFPCQASYGCVAGMKNVYCTGGQCYMRYYGATTATWYYYTGAAVFFLALVIWLWCFRCRGSHDFYEDSGSVHVVQTTVTHEPAVHIPAGGGFNTNFDLSGDYRGDQGRGPVFTVTQSGNSINIQGYGSGEILPGQQGPGGEPIALVINNGMGGADAQQRIINMGDNFFTYAGPVGSQGGGGFGQTEGVQVFS